MLDITGCAHLFGGEAALGRDLLRRLAAQGFHARAAIADTVGCASAVARYAPLLPLPGSAEGRGAARAELIRKSRRMTLTLSPTGERERASASG